MKGEIYYDILVAATWSNN